MPITAVIAEDEPLLRAQLQTKLARLWPTLQIVAEVGDGEAALEAIAQFHPDLVFLDIQMPEMNGVEVARSLAANPELRCHVVFVTAFDQYAAQAFETDAVDYLLKPYTDARLQAAIERLQARLAQVPAAPAQDLDALVARLGARLAPARERLQWIKASVGQNLRLIPIDEVLFFQSDEKYTLVATADTDALIRTPIKELMESVD
ncbi:MAG: LytR/AlgR family response regulator transcription factor, partial [Rhodoferax sp.]